MSFNLSNRVNNLATLIASTIPSSGVVSCNSLTATTGAITNLSSTGLSSNTINCGNITNTQSISIAATSVVLGVVGITLTGSDASRFTVGQIVLITGNSNALFNNVKFVVTLLSLPNIIYCSNPSAIPNGQTGLGGTSVSGIISTVNINAVKIACADATISNDLTVTSAVNATNLNGKLNIVGQTTSTAGNIVYTANTTNTTGNYDLLTDSAQHFTFLGGSGVGSNTMSIGGSTYGGLTIPSTSGEITVNKLSSNAATKLVLNSTEALGNIEFQKSGVKTGHIAYVVPGFPLELESTTGLSLTGRLGYVNIASHPTSAGYAINFYTNNTNRFYISDSGVVVRYGGSVKIYRPDEANSWETYISGTSQYVIRQNGGSDYYLNGGQPNAVWNFSSDERLKENIQLAPSYLETILSIPIKTYNYTKQPEIPCIGFIAQDLQKLPLLLNIVSDSPTSAPDGTPYLGIGSTGLIPYMIKAFQEQHKIVQEQQDEITDLKAQLASLKAVVDALVAQKQQQQIEITQIQELK